MFVPLRRGEGQFAVVAQSVRKPKKKLIRRTDADRSQVYRRSFQGAFLVLNLWLGGKFYFWVRQFEVGVIDTNLHRPEVLGFEWQGSSGASRGAVFAGHVSGHLVSVSQGVLQLALPHRDDLGISVARGEETIQVEFSIAVLAGPAFAGLEIFLLGFFVWAISGMSAMGIRDFMLSPYGLIADVKMLNFFRHLGETGLTVLGIFVLASVFVQNFWCRFLCPYGALLGLTSWLSPTRIRRNTEACIDCAKCAKACPSALPVDKLVQIRSVECTGCLEWWQFAPRRMHWR